jgi:hypothetical protein
VSYLVDTNIIGELSRPVPDVHVVRWSEAVVRHYLSAVTVEEIWFGVARRPAARLVRWMGRYLPRQEVVPVTKEIARRAGELRGELSRRSITRLQAGMLLAASAQLHGLTLVTRNVHDFAECVVPVLNPFGEGNA